MCLCLFVLALAVLVVPEEWAHATLNAAPSIGVAHEVLLRSHNIL